MKRTSKAGNPLIDQIKAHSKRTTKVEGHLKKDDLIPMGSTLLNLAMSGTIYGGAKKGTMINIIGASHGGKTILALTSFAEANMKESFDDYKFIYDDVERANSFDMNYLFGKSTAKRITPPRLDKDDHFSSTVQHFQANLLHWTKKDIPFIYVLDSYDALDALEDQKKAQEQAESLEKGKDTAGTYGMAKAKAGSSILRAVTAKIADTQSLLFIISQTRDNVDPMSFSKETRSGGRALKFYANHEMWLKPAKAIKRKDTIIGNTVKVKITKNKLTGKNREVEFDIYYDYGIDDIGSCIDYLLKMSHWGGGGSGKITHSFDFPPCTKSKLVSAIEENDLHLELKKIVEKVWNEFEDTLKLNRKKKYE